MTTLAILDDHAIVANALADSLNATASFKVVGIYTTIDAFIDSLRYQQPEILLLDMDLNDEHHRRGDFVVDYLSHNYQKIKIVVLSSFISAKEFFALEQMSPNISFITKDKPLDVLLSGLQEVGTMGNFNQSQYNEQQKRHTQKEICRKQDIILSSLSHRQLALLEYMALGLTSIEIGEKLNLSNHTINSDKKYLLELFDAPNATNLIFKAMHMGILPTRSDNYTTLTLSKKIAC